jgi:XapX domain-containing protein
MSAGLLSLFAGVVIGLLYALLKFRSPAPPAVALVGLLGMLAGEHLTAEMLRPAPTTAQQSCQLPSAACAEKR